MAAASALKKVDLMGELMAVMMVALMVAMMAELTVYPMAGTKAWMLAVAKAVTMV